MKDNFKSGFTAIIGRPNVGKSTLMNHLIGQKIAITSKKPQTTRNRIQTVYTCEDGQIVFLDTPGIHKAKNKLAIIPKVKDTAKYPRPMGTPSWSPFLKAVLFMMIFSPPDCSVHGSHCWSVRFL